VTAPILHVVVGPNGAGKSTLYTRVLGPGTHLPFVNADVMYADHPDRYADEYEAGMTAAAERTARIDRRESFVTETVFSHPSKLQVLRDAGVAGYLVHLHVVAIPADLAVARVAQRVDRGGHDVAEDRIRSRYDRLWSNVVEALPLVRDLTVYDNSSAANPLRVIARFHGGGPVRDPEWPAWAPPDLMSLHPPG